MGLSHALETAAVRVAWALLRALGPARSSAVGGWLARTVGPLLPVSEVARRNLSMALPERDAAARRAILRAAWDNLGRTAAEFPHVAALRPTASGPGFEVEGTEHVPAQGPMLLLSAHFGNWEVLPVISRALGIPMATFYRAAANPAVDAIMTGQRERASGAPTFAKGARGAKQAMAWLRSGGALGMLVDQKMNDGIEARFFGMPAMTATAAAAFALRYDAPVVLGRALRLGPARVRLICDPPLRLRRTGDRGADIALLTQAINDRLEAWIRADPGQWLWLHRRWPAPTHRVVAPPQTSGDS